MQFPKVNGPSNRRYSSPELFRDACLEYFNNPDKNNGIMTPCGLMLHLDMSDGSWREYARLEGYKEICEWAKRVTEHWVESKLLLENKPVGAIFQLKSVYGRSDQPASKSETNNYVYVFGNEAKKIKHDAILNDQVIEYKPECKLIEDNVMLTTGKSEIEELKINSKSPSSSVRLGVPKKPKSKPKPNPKPKAKPKSVTKEKK